MALFKIVREKEISREQEVAILHEKGINKDKLAMDLLYDRQWCKEQGIRYYDLKTQFEGIGLSALEIAENFVSNSIKHNLTQCKE